MSSHIATVWCVYLKVDPTTKNAPENSCFLWLFLRKATRCIHTINKCMWHHVAMYCHHTIPIFAHSRFVAMEGGRERESRFVGLYLNGFTPFEPISFMIVSNIDILTCCLQHTGPRKLGTLLILMCDDLGRPLALLEMIHGIFGALLKSRLPLGFGVWKFGEFFIGVSWGCFIIKVWATSQQV